MNTNLHEFFLEPRNTLIYTEGLNGLFPCIPWLINNSALSTLNSELGEAAWLKEIQR